MGNGRAQQGQARLGARRDRRAGRHGADRRRRRRARLASGTDYFDPCGEPVWMRQMIDAHEATAKSSGARIVFSCGFDSLPFELGVLFCEDTAKKVLGGPVSRVKTRIRNATLAFSGGTFASAKA